MAEGVSGSTQSVSESYQETGRVVRTEAEKQAQSVKESTEIIAESLALREMSHEEFVESIKTSNEEYIKREQELTIALAKEQEKRRPIGNRHTHRGQMLDYEPRLSDVPCRQGRRPGA